MSNYPGYDKKEATDAYFRQNSQTSDIYTNLTL